LSLKKGRVELEADLGAECWIAAEKGIEKIAVEIKGFIKASVVYSFHVIFVLLLRPYFSNT